MALFKASTARAGHEFVDCDLNVDMYRAASPEDRKLWDARVANRWGAEAEGMIGRFGAHLDAYIDRMIEADVELYALSINSYSMHLAFWMARRIKQRNPRAGVLFGGPQCFPAYSGLDILEHEGVDAICTGEADVIWPLLLEHFARTGDLCLDVPGISYRRLDGTIADNGVPEVVRNLDSVPFADYSDLDFTEYGGSGQLAIMTSRGCINTCAFCSERPNFQKYRYRQAENVFAEISRHLGARRANGTVQAGGASRRPYIRFNDSLINGVPRELERLCDLVIQNGLEFGWGGMALIRREMTPGLLAKMKRAGCTDLAWGLESGSQRVLELMHKRFFTRGWSSSRAS